MRKCNVCRCEVAEVCTDLVTCPVLDDLLGPVHPPKRKRPNQCSVEGCNRNKVKYSAYCQTCRNERSKEYQRQRRVTG